MRAAVRVSGLPLGGNTRFRPGECQYTLRSQLLPLASFFMGAAAADQCQVKLAARNHVLFYHLDRAWNRVRRRALCNRSYRGRSLRYWSSSCLQALALHGGRSPRAGLAPRSFRLLTVLAPRRSGKIAHPPAPAAWPPDATPRSRRMDSSEARLHYSFAYPGVSTRGPWDAHIFGCHQTKLAGSRTCNQSVTLSSLAAIRFIALLPFDPATLYCTSS